MHIIAIYGCFLLGMGTKGTLGAGVDSQQSTDQTRLLSVEESPPPPDTKTLSVIASSIEMQTQSGIEEKKQRIADYSPILAELREFDRKYLARISPRISPLEMMERKKPRYVRHLPPPPAPKLKTIRVPAHDPPLFNLDDNPDDRITSQIDLDNPVPVENKSLCCACDNAKCCTIQ